MQTLNNPYSLELYSWLHGRKENFEYNVQKWKYFLELVENDTTGTICIRCPEILGDNYDEIICNLDVMGILKKTLTFYNHDSKNKQKKNFNSVEESKENQTFFDRTLYELSDEVRMESTKLYDPHKWKEFNEDLEKCKKANQGKQNNVVITFYLPEVLGDNYKELICNLHKIAEEKLDILILPPISKDNKENYGHYEDVITINKKYQKNKRKPNKNNIADRCNKIIRFENEKEEMEKQCQKYGFRIYYGSLYMDKHENNWISK